MHRIRPWIFTLFAAGMGLQLVAATRLEPLLGFRAALLVAGLLPLVWICFKHPNSAPGLPLRLLLTLIVIAVFWLGVLEVWLSFTIPLALGLICLCTTMLAHGTFIFARFGPIGSQSDPGGLIVRIGLLLSVTAFLLAAMEAGFRLVVPANVYEIVPDRGQGPCLILGKDGILHLTPGFKGRYIHPEFPNLKVEINADGLRDGLDESMVARDGKASVLLLGDSQAFGTGVELLETFQELLEQDQAGIVARGLCVHCAAVPGDGQVQQLDRLKRWAPRLEPDVVVVAMYEGNDFRDNVWVGGRRHGILPTRSATGGVKKRNLNPPDPTLYRFLRGILRSPYWRGSSSAVQYLLPTIQTGLAHLGWMDRHVPMNGMLKQLLEREPPGVVRIAAHYTMDLLTEISTLTREFGAELVIVVIPAAVQAEPGRFADFLLSFSPTRREQFDRTASHVRFVNDLEAHGFRVVDSFAALEQAALENHSPFHDEGHLNRRGHLLLRDLLAPVLKELLSDSP